MIILLEILTAALGISLLYQEAIKRRFLNYATSIFLLGFVPLLCVYPVIARLAVGGAYTVRPGVLEVIADPWVYVCYQAFCLSILLVSFATMRTQVTDRPYVGWREKYKPNLLELVAFAALIVLGVFLYVYSTGYSVSELLVASRFEYFTSAEYSPVIFVISSYLIALSPVALTLALQQRRDRVIFVALIVILIFYGLLAKDRKWLIYIVSALFAFYYIKNGYRLSLNRKGATLVALVIAALAFWQVGRGVVFNYLVTGNGDVVYESQEVALNLLTRGDFPYYYNASITAIDLNINDDFLIPLAVLRRQLLFFLPADYSFGLKIEDISAIFSDAIGGEDLTRRGNMPPGFFGLLVISFGWLGGIVACLLVPLALRWLDYFIHRNRGLGSVVVVTHLLSSVTLLLRGDDSSATYFIVSSLAIFYLLRALFQLRQAPRATTRAETA